MLIEPVLVSTRRETVPSHLMIVVDDSESMKFSDPYTDNSRAVDIATRLKLESAGGKSPVDRLRETPRLELVKTVLGPNLEALARGRELFIYNLESAAQPGGGAIGPNSQARRHPAEPRLFAAGRRPARRAGRSSRPAGRRRDPGDGRPIQHRRRSAPAPSRPPPARTSRSSRSPPGATRARAIFASPRSRSARSSSCATR